jgi:hypothetical protein
MLNDLNLKCFFYPKCQELIPYQKLALHQQELCVFNRVKCKFYDQPVFGPSGEIIYKGCHSYFRLQDKLEHERACENYRMKLLPDQEEELSCDLCKTTETKFVGKQQLAIHQRLECKNSPQALRMCTLCQSSLPLQVLTTSHMNPDSNSMCPKLQ